MDNYTKAKNSRLIKIFSKNIKNISNTFISVNKITQIILTAKIRMANNIQKKKVLKFL